MTGDLRKSYGVNNVFYNFLLAEIKNWSNVYACTELRGIINHPYFSTQKYIGAHNSNNFMKIKGILFHNKGLGKNQERTNNKCI